MLTNVSYQFNKLKVRVCIKSASLWNPNVKHIYCEAFSSHRFPVNTNIKKLISMHYGQSSIS